MAQARRHHPAQPEMPRAASVTVRPIARTLSRRRSPGCAGLSILPMGASSVMVRHVDIDHLAFVEAKDDAPVIRHPDAALSATVTFERMQLQSPALHAPRGWRGSSGIVGMDRARDAKCAGGRRPPSCSNSSWSPSLRSGGFARLAIEALAQLLARLEMHHMPRGHRHRAPRRRVAGDSRVVKMRREAREAPGLDAPASGKARRHLLKYRLHRELDVALGKQGLLLRNPTDQLGSDHPPVVA